MRVRLPNAKVPISHESRSHICALPASLRLQSETGVYSLGIELDALDLHAYAAHHHIQGMFAVLKPELFRILPNRFNNLRVICLS